MRYGNPIQGIECGINAISAIAYHIELRNASENQLNCSGMSECCRSGFMSETESSVLCGCARPFLYVCMYFETVLLFI